MLLYLDDDIGWHFSKTSVKHLSMKVRQDMIECGFTLNDQESVNLGVNSNNNYFRCYSQFYARIYSYPLASISSTARFAFYMLYRSDVLVRVLASLTSQIIAMSCADGNRTRLPIKNCYFAIEAVNHWDHSIPISSTFRYKLQFWLQILFLCTRQANVTKPYI